MNVSLTKELENFIEDKVKSGMYSTASEVVREGLRMLKLRELQLEVQKGVGLVNAEQTTSLNIEDIKTSGRERLGNNNGE